MFLKCVIINFSTLKTLTLEESQKSTTHLCFSAGIFFDFGPRDIGSALLSEMSELRKHIKTEKKVRKTKSYDKVALKP